ncbi:MAG: histidine kinase dimerization/phospho-acceptor domain-containing protein [Pseudomonadota bacterium]
MNIDPAQKRPASVFADISRRKRSADFIVLCAGAGALFAVFGLFGLVEAWAALVAPAIFAMGALAYFIGTSDYEVVGKDDTDVAAADAVELKIESERAVRAALIEALPEPTLFVDADGRIEIANAEARRRFRFVGQEPLLSAVVRRPEVLTAVEDARETGDAQMFEFMERDETDVFYACVAALVHSEGGSGVLLTMHDLTDIRRAELSRADFLANASHELRTPLTSLAGFIETMRGPARDDHEAWDRFLEIMHGQTERMRRLINDLLSLSRIELTEHKPPETMADLAAVVSEVGDALTPLAEERDVRLRISGPASGVLVAGVRDELTQVAQNLIDNAIKYSRAGDVVEIEVLTDLAREEAAARAGRRWPDAARISIASAPAGSSLGPPRRSDETGTPAGAMRYAVLRVSDSGPGIGRRHLPRLAERFYRVDPGRGLKRGTGLGLAIVKHVVTRHRGEFLVESVSGAGAAFGVLLPNYEPSNVELGEADTDNDAPFDERLRDQS